MTAADPLVALQQALGHRFANAALLARALTHRSHSADHNERLEFLGDAVLSLAVSAMLFGRLDKAAEGDLSRIRANLVKQDTLADLAQRLGLSALLRLGAGEMKTGGRQRPSILADALEALIGAVYLDAGYPAAAGVVQHLFRDLSLVSDQAAMGKDPKTALQELLQGRRLALPSYRVVDVTGLAHQQSFCVACDVAVDPPLSAQGQGVSRRAAEQAAAAAVLALLQNRKRS
jgi:ribonuclease-3